MAKVCSCGCGRPVFAKGLSIVCWRPVHGKPIAKKSIEQKPRKAIARESAKRVVENRQYSKDRVIYLLTNNKCKMRLPGCTYEATEVHHQKGRIGKLLLDRRWWMPGCNNCHTQVTDMGIEEAIERGLSLRRNGKE